MLRDTCRNFADTELAPKAGEWDKNHMFPADAVKKMGEMGLMGVAQVCVPAAACVRPVQAIIMCVCVAGYREQRRRHGRACVRRGS